MVMELLTITTTVLTQPMPIKPMLMVMEQEMFVMMIGMEMIY